MAKAVIWAAAQELKEAEDADDSPRVLIAHRHSRAVISAACQAHERLDELKLQPTRSAMRKGSRTASAPDKELGPVSELARGHGVKEGRQIAEGSQPKVWLATKGLIITGLRVRTLRKASNSARSIQK